jgi:hypothetical protein
MTRDTPAPSLTFISLLMSSQREQEQERRHESMLRDLLDPNFGKRELERARLAFYKRVPMFSFVLSPVPLPSPPPNAESSPYQN